MVKIERHGGDFARGYDTAADGDSTYFAWANHGKESAVLDIKDPEDARLLNRMVSAADVFVQNLAPGALDRAGFGSDDLRTANPGLITCDISGYGESPERAGMKAYDLLVQAESGLIGISGGPSELGRIGISLADIGTGITAYGAILEALIGRSISGRGAGVRLSLFDVMAEWMTVPYVQHKHGGSGPTRVGLHHPTIAPYGAYATSDGALTLISIQNEREWVRLCEDVLGRPELAVDRRLASNNLRVEHRADLDSALDAVIATMTRSEFQRRLADASIAYGSVNTLDDLVAHPALRLRMVQSSGGAVVDLPAHPVRWAGTRSSATDSVEPTPTVPAIGAQTDRIRAEFHSDAALDSGWGS